MMKIMTSWRDENGVRHEQRLKMNDIITVRRYETAFSYSQAPGEPVKMSVRDAIKNSALDTMRGTMSVVATTVIHGVNCTAWMVH